MGKAVIAIHGGAGAISRAQMTPEREREYGGAVGYRRKRAENAGCGRQRAGCRDRGRRLLEECPLFNAGIGAVFTRDQTHELDACVMDGYSLQAGAVAGVKHLRNPVLAARLVLEKSPHVLLIGEGAENFAFSHGWRASITISFPPRAPAAAAGGESGRGDHPRPPRRSMNARWAPSALALDLAGNLAAATSTGGMTNKLPGRVGDSPLPGAVLCQ
jgi:beta-aspartyl-peptidase (threonine type)